MGAVGMSGSDTLNVNGRILADLADGEVAALTFPNDIANVKTGKNGNSLYALNESGRQCEFKLRVIRGSDDDKFMNNLMANQINNFAGFPLMFGEFIKRVGDGKGNIANDTYLTSGGVFVKRVEAKSNVEGEVDQSVAEYHIKFSNNTRVIA